MTDRKLILTISTNLLENVFIEKLDDLMIRFTSNRLLSSMGIDPTRSRSLERDYDPLKDAIQDGRMDCDRLSLFTHFIPFNQEKSS